MVWLGIFGAFAAILSTITGHILVVLERERAMFLINWTKLAIFLASVLAAAQSNSTMNIAIAATLSTAVVTVGCIFYLPRALPVSAPRILLEMFPIFLASVAMFLVVRLFHLDTLHIPFITLSIDALVGAAVFVSILAICWVAAGQPDGLERRAIQLLSRQVQRVTSRR